MNEIFTNKATICASNNCVTVYGNTAKLVNAVVVTTALIVALVFIEKALK